MPGIMCFPELNEKLRSVKTGDFVEISVLDTFQIQRLFIDRWIGLSLFGKVTDIRSGALLFSRMPTYLEWLRSNNSLVIYIGTLTSVMSIILAVFYRLKIFDKV